MSRPLTGPQREALLQLARGEVCTARWWTVKALRVAGLHRTVDPPGVTPRGAALAAEELGLRVDVTAWAAAFAERDEAAGAETKAWNTYCYRSPCLLAPRGRPRVDAARVAYDAARVRLTSAIAAEEAARREVLAALRGGAR